jgi:6-phosphogluconolactonase
LKRLFETELSQIFPAGLQESNRAVSDGQPGAAVPTLRKPVLWLFAFKFSQESWMLQKALVLVLVAASITGFTSCGSTANHYIYAALPAANQIIAYREDPNSSVLTQLAGSPYSVGNGAYALALHPSGKFLYAANTGTAGSSENDISLFTIASNGVLTEVFPRTPVTPNASTPQLLRIDAAGAFLYVLNAGSNNISVFSIDSGTGALTTVVGSPVAINAPPLDMQLTPSGNFLFVSVASQPLSLIIGFSVNAGVLTVVSGTHTRGINPNGLAIDPSGTHLYAVNYGSNSISVFSIGTPSSPGALTEVSGSPIDSGYTAPVALLLDTSGKYLYVANQGSNNVAAYSINSTTGLPDILTTSTTTGTVTTTTGTVTTESSPSFLVADPSGKYLYVGNQGTSAGIQAFGVSNGNFTTLSTYGVGNTPKSIVVLGK